MSSDFSECFLGKIHLFIDWYFALGFLELDQGLLRIIRIFNNWEENVNAILLRCASWFFFLNKQNFASSEKVLLE
jgi:hypothetical protein